MSSDMTLLALPAAKAARLAGVTPRQLRYWEQIDLVTPSTIRRVGQRGTVRLYHYQDLLDLLVAATLRMQRHMSLQHIRRVVEHLRTQGYEAPLRELSFAIFGQEIYFQHPNGEWEGSLRKDQLVLEQTIHLDPLRAQIRDATRRNPANAGKIVHRRGVHRSKPIFAGTRIPVSAVQEYLIHGFGAEEILEAHPDLTEADVATARESLTVA